MRLRSRTAILVENYKFCIEHTPRIRPSKLVFVALIAFVLLFPSLQNSSRLSASDVSQAKDEGGDNLSCLVYHSTIGVFRQPVGRDFTPQTCPFSKLKRFLMTGHFLRKRETPRCPVLNSSTTMPSL